MRRTIIALTLALLTAGCPGRNDELSEAQLNPADEGAQNWSPTFDEVPERSECTPDKVAEVTEPVVEMTPVVINCNLTLEQDDVVTKRVILQGQGSSGVTVDCNGARISPVKPDGLDSLEIRSILVNEQWQNVHDVTVNDCVVEGSIRIYGMGKNDGDEDLRLSSRTLEHVTNARNNAPYHIALNNVTIIGEGRIPLYMAPGVHHAAILDSEIRGFSKSVLIYLDAETYGIEIENNVFDAANGWREVIALDGSSYNSIVNNEMKNVDLGGIYLYRNCGENGTIRHATPSHNRIEDNDIDCEEWFGLYAGIYLGSRNGDRGYCDEDAGYPYGSSVSDQDHARFNTVIGNNLHDCSVKTGNKTNHSNTVD